MRALVFGSGGASKAVQYALTQADVPFQLVSRWSTELCYADLTKGLIASHHLLINTTPLGTFPNVNRAVNIPYSAISSKHSVYDLIYNPAESKFLRKARKQGAKVINGLAMLELQAEESWAIWAQ